MGGLIPREVRAYLDLGRERYNRLDPEERLRAHVESGYPLRTDDARILLDRLDRRDGCHRRHESVEAAARLLLHALTEPALGRSDVLAATDALRDVLTRVGATDGGEQQREQDQARVRVVRSGVEGEQNPHTWTHRVCSCPRDPDDEVDPGDPISTCRVHGWA
jgi:hypothetical protein